MHQPKLTEGENKLKFPNILHQKAAFQVSPSVKTYGFATSLIRERRGAAQDWLVFPKKHQPRLPLTRELAAKPTEGEKKLTGEL